MTSQRGTATIQPPVAVPGRTAIAPAPSTAGSSAVSRTHSMPGTFLLGTRRRGGGRASLAAPASLASGGTAPPRDWARAGGGPEAPFALRTVAEEPTSSAGPASEVTLAPPPGPAWPSAAPYVSSVASARSRADMTASLASAQYWAAELTARASWPQSVLWQGSTVAAAPAQGGSAAGAGAAAGGAPASAAADPRVVAGSVYSVQSSAAGRTASVFDEQCTQSEAAAPLPSELARESVGDAALSAWGGSLLQSTGALGSEASRIGAIGCPSVVKGSTNCRVHLATCCHADATRMRAESRASSATSQASVLRKAWLQPGRLGALDAEQQPQHNADGLVDPLPGVLPVQRVLTDALVGPISAQYRLVSSACMHVVLHELCLLRVCDALRGLVLAGDSGVVRALLDGIAAGVAACEGVLTAARLQAALAGATAGLPFLDHPGAPVSSRCATACWRLRVAATHAHHHSTSAAPRACSFVIQPARQVPAEEAPRSHLQFTPQLPAAQEDDAISLQDWNGGGAAINPLFDARDWTVGAVPLDCANVRALDPLKLVVRVGGPLSCVLTPTALGVLSGAARRLLLARAEALRVRRCGSYLSILLHDSDGAGGKLHFVCGHPRLRRRCLV